MYSSDHCAETSISPLVANLIDIPIKTWSIEIKTEFFDDFYQWNSKRIIVRLVKK